GGHSGGKGSGSTSSKGSDGSKSVHVKEYTKKDGTHVEAYDRKPPSSMSDAEPSLASVARTSADGRRPKAPQASTSTSPQPARGIPASPSLAELSRAETTHAKTPTHTIAAGTPRSSTNQIYTTTDPTTGRKTFTNIAPAPPPPTVAQPTAVQ